MTPLIVITIPQYPERVQVAKARRPIFYVSKDSKVRGKSPIPPSFNNPEKYFFNEKGVLCNHKTGEPQLANPKSAGTPRYWVVNFQDIWNQNLTKQARASHVDKLKVIFRPYVQQIEELREFPIEISLVIYDIKCPVDISNKGVIYTKVIEDLLVKEGKIPDDSVQYINCSGRTKFIEITDESQVRMEVRIYKSDDKPF
jgi:hypothetical protein